MRALLKWIQTTCFCSRTAHSLTMSETPSATCRTKSHLCRACDVASSVWGPAAAGVLWWLFETVEQLKQAIADEWCALSQKFIDRSINEWPLRLKCVVQQSGRHIKHLLSNFSVVGYTWHFCYSLCTFVNSIALLIFFASSTFTRMLFYLAPPTVIPMYQVKVASNYLS